jgi:hypothetical protein
MKPYQCVLCKGQNDRSSSGLCWGCTERAGSGAERVNERAAEEARKAASNASFNRFLGIALLTIIFPGAPLAWCVHYVLLNVAKVTDDGWWISGFFGWFLPALGIALKFNDWIRKPWVDWGLEQ